MNPQVIYQTSIARTDELRRQADASRLAAETGYGRRSTSSRWRRPVSARVLPRWRAGRGPKPSISKRFA
jgi:hypothetical protein